MQRPNFKPFHGFVSLFHRLEALAREGKCGSLADFLEDPDKALKAKMNKECRARGYDSVEEVVHLADGYWEPPTKGRKATAQHHAAPGRSLWGHLKPQALEMLDKGMTVNQISKSLQCSYQAVRYWKLHPTS